MTLLIAINALPRLPESMKLKNDRGVLEKLKHDRGILEKLKHYRGILENIGRRKTIVRKAMDPMKHYLLP